MDMMKGVVEPRRLNWDSSPKFSRGVPALKMAPGFPVKLKVQGEYVSVQSTSAKEIRQHKIYRPCTKDKYKKQARGRTPRLAEAPSDWAKLREVGQNPKKRSTIPAAPSPKQHICAERRVVGAIVINIPS
ncbi:hypothetical protein Taro_030435 [Colocasia esculenta]|uniref:Uncharacterized protein n=1 Tax=Colocasia esculenta TaxID=4460 RepID=A0A843W3B6_COLES|nr:hypothetical protein [Colocasia esculenta]